MNTYTQPVLPYVYRLDNPTTGEFYIGYRCINKVPSHADLGVKYFTSSKSVKHRFQEFNSVILAEFFDSKSAYDYEQELIYESWNTPGILNKIHYHNKNMFSTLGMKHTKETREKQSISLKGKHKTSEHCANISRAAKGRCISQETREKISAKTLGKPKTYETRLRMGLAQAGNISGAKHYVMTSPEGVITEIYNMKQFCLDKNLSPGGMSSVIKGTRAYHKGWTKAP